MVRRSPCGGIGLKSYGCVHVFYNFAIWFARLKCHDRIGPGESLIDLGLISLAGFLERPSNKSSTKNHDHGRAGHTDSVWSALGVKEYAYSSTCFARALIVGCGKTATASHALEPTRPSRSVSSRRGPNNP
eukprot:4347637-Amphidinium_carterae.1